MKMYFKEITCCLECPNYSDLGRQCQANQKSIEIPSDFDVSQDVYNCPLPDIDNVIETMGNPNTSLTEKEEQLLLDVCWQNRDRLSWQQCLSRVLRERMLPKIMGLKPRPLGRLYDWRAIIRVGGSHDSS